MFCFSPVGFDVKLTFRALAVRPSRHASTALFTYLSVCDFQKSRFSYSLNEKSVSPDLPL